MSVTINGSTGVQYTDDIKQKFGTGDDLEIYHQSSNNGSYIKEGGSGNLYIFSENLRIENADGSKSYIEANANGTVELYHDGTKRLATNSSGASFYGDLWANDNDKITLGFNNDLEIYHNGSNSKIHNNTGRLDIETDSFRVYNHAGSENMIDGNADGAVNLYYNNSKKFETTSEGTKTTGYNKSFLVEGDSAFGSTDAHVLQSNSNNQVGTILEHSGDSHPYGLVVSFSDSSPDGHNHYFIKAEDSTTNRFLVYADGDVWNHDNSYTGSDRTLKENIVDATPKLEDLKKLKVRNFNWKADYFPEKSKQKQLGFIAQEVEQVFPSLVAEHDIAPGTPGDDHTPVMKKAIKQAWDPIIIKAMQELIEKVETLETKVAALEVHTHE